MANYLPVLLVSVTAGMPDDAALQPLPRGQVDYLSHNWTEEDVWRSWRNMTKQKNEIANGVRLENASWRTWMKQRNKLKTVSPETLNWLKDSDVTWLYGPLHTAVDWTPPPKPAISPPAAPQAKDDASAPSPKSAGANSLSSPSSSVALDRLNQPTGRYALPPHEGGTMKPILKHRSIAEMLTSALPPAPSWAEESSEFTREIDGKDHETRNNRLHVHPQQDRQEALMSGRGGRPPLYHTRSDTNVLPRFGPSGTVKKAHVSPPRIAEASADHSSSSGDSSPQAYSGSLSPNQRTGASNNLADLAFSVGANRGAQSSGQSTSSPYRSAVPLEVVESSGTSVFTNDTASNGRSESEGSMVSPMASLAPQKKHISFNAIVEQCIAIDGSSEAISPSVRGHPWSTYADDGSCPDSNVDMVFDRYTQDNEDGLYEDVGASLGGDSDSENEVAVDEEEEDERLEIKPPSRRSSSGSLQDHRTVFATQQAPASRAAASDVSERPQFRRSSTGSNRFSRSRKSTSAGSGSGSGSNSGRTSEAGRSRSSVALDREHVTIAPIAPTILKTGGAEDNEDGMLYMAGSPFPTYGIEASSSGSSGGYGYGYGGYGFGEHVSAGRTDAFEHFERGTDAGELVYQSPNGNIYPWGEGDAIRFRMQTEYGMPSPPGSPPHGHGLNPQHESFAYRIGSAGLPSSYVVSETGQIVPGPLVRSPGEVSDEAIFEQFDPVEGPVEAPRDGRERVPDGQQRGDDTVSRASEPQAGIRHEDDAVRIIEPQPSGSADSVDWEKSRVPQPGSPREREPSPDFQPKINPRIASLKSESGWCSPPASPPQTNTEFNTSLAPSSTTLAIPTPGISPAHEQEYARMRSPPDSPVLRSGLLSPPDMSPRGRSICTSPVSGSATSSSQARSNSRSVSESRSDSRGRSRTRNSSLASSPEQGEPERGRSRSRSTASGANSPLGDNGSPSMRGSPLTIGGIGVGLGIGGGCGVQHSGREIRDGRGVRLYRKTSEDFIRGNDTDGKGGQSDVYPSHGTRGRNREGKRVSESLSPPVVGSPPVDRRSAVSPPHASGVYRPIPSSGLRSYPANLPGRSNSGDSLRSLGSDRSNVQSPDGSSLLSSRRSNSSRSGSREHTDSTSADETLSASASTVIGNGSTLPPCIPEEDEVKIRTVHPSEVQNHVESKDIKQSSPQDKSSFPPSSTTQKREESGSNRHPSTYASSLSSPKAEGEMNPDPGKPGPSSGANSFSPAGIGRNKANGASEGTGDGTGKTFGDRTADLMSSARTLLGTFWNSSNS